VTTSEALQLNVLALAGSLLRRDAPGVLLRLAAPASRAARRTVVATVDFDALKLGLTGDVEQTVQLSPVSNPRRWYARCACGRRQAILYALSGSTFACRRCVGLVYPSTRKDTYARAVSRVDKMRARLGVVAPPFAFGQPLSKLDTKPPRRWRESFDADRLRLARLELRAVQTITSLVLARAARSRREASKPPAGDLPTRFSRRSQLTQTASTPRMTTPTR
jgi:hypothetical protein